MWPGRGRVGRKEGRGRTEEEGMGIRWGHCVHRIRRMDAPDVFLGEVLGAVAAPTGLQAMPANLQRPIIYTRGFAP